MDLWCRDVVCFDFPHSVFTEASDSGFTPQQIATLMEMMRTLQAEAATPGPPGPQGSPGPQGIPGRTGRKHTKLHFGSCLYAACTRSLKSSDNCTEDVRKAFASSGTSHMGVVPGGLCGRRGPPGRHHHGAVPCPRLPSGKVHSVGRRGEGTAGFRWFLPGRKLKGYVEKSLPSYIPKGASIVKAASKGESKRAVKGASKRASKRHDKAT